MHHHLDGNGTAIIAVNDLEHKHLRLHHDRDIIDADLDHHNPHRCHHHQVTNTIIILIVSIIAVMTIIKLIITITIVIFFVITYVSSTTASQSWESRSPPRIRLLNALVQRRLGRHPANSMRVAYQQTMNIGRVWGRPRPLWPLAAVQVEILNRDHS